MCIYIYIHYKACIFGPAASIAGVSELDPAAASIAGVSELDPAVGVAFVGGDRLVAGCSAGGDGRGYFGGTTICFLTCLGGVEQF